MHPEPVKKEDLPPELLKAIEEHFAQTHPGIEIKFMGDEAESDLPPELIQRFDQQGAAFRDSLVNGTCIDCQKKIPGNWPLNDEDKMPEGWSVIFDLKERPIYLTCDECDNIREAQAEVFGFPPEWQESLKNGTCICCKEKMPGPYPPPPGSALPEGWAIVVDDFDKPNFIVCDRCDPPDVE